MKIIICGAGLSGRAIAEKLSQIGNEVTIIDSSKRLIEKLGNKLDIRGIVGHGAHPDILGEAGAADAEMLISVTPSDEINMMACQVAHSLFEVPKRIARVRDKSYLNPSYQDLFTSSNLPVNIIISPEKEVAISLFRRLEAPGALDNVPFAENKIRLLEILIDKKCSIQGIKLNELTKKFPKLNAYILGVIRNEKFVVMKKTDQLQLNDKAYVVVNSSQMQETLTVFGHNEKISNKMLIIGGGNIGFNLAKNIEQSFDSARVKIIEKDKSRAEYLSLIHI